MFEASQCIHRDYRSRLLALDDDKYYQEVDRVLDTYGTPPVQDYRLANQAPGPHQTTQELMQIFGKGRGQVCREELHRHRPFSARTRSLQSCIQQKIRKTQQMRQRYANAQELSHITIHHVNSKRCHIKVLPLNVIISKF